MFLFFRNSCADIQFIGFYKIAPVTIFLSATRIKIMVLDLFPGFRDLVGNDGFVFRCDEKFFFFVILFVVRFNKIKFSTDHLPVRLHFGQPVIYKIQPVASNRRPEDLFQLVPLIFGLALSGLPVL